MVAAIVITAAPAMADPACTPGKSAYLLFARGSQDTTVFDGREASVFFSAVKTQLNQRGIPSNYAELGNLDRDYSVGWGEYPAVKGLWEWVVKPGYNESVSIGTNELVKHLNDRTERCPNEAVVLGGYSQGADVIGDALSRTGYGSINAFARSRIAFVALYSDPTYSGNCLMFTWQTRRNPWVRGDETPCVAVTIPIPPRTPYLPPDFHHRTGSWCASGDGLCMHSPGPGSHGDATYANVWIPASAPEIAQAVRAHLYGPNGDGSIVGSGGTGNNSPPAPSRLLFLRGDSAVFGKDGLAYGGWVQQTDPASIKAIAAGGKYHMVLNACNAVYAKDTLGMGGWVQETPCGGANKIAVSNTGLQMLIDACGAVWAKYGIGMGGWTQEVGCGNADAIAVGGNNQLFLRGDKAVFWRSGVGTDWHMQVGPLNAVAIAADNTGMLAFARHDGALFAKRGHYGDGGWQMQASPGNTYDIAAGGGVLAFKRGDGAVFAKTNISVEGYWQQQADPGTVNLLAVGNNGDIMVRSNTNAIYAKNNLVNGDWKLQVGDGNAEAIAIG